MTLPASPPMTSAQVAAECLLSAPFDSENATIRRVAGVPSGPYSSTNLLGKSNTVANRQALSPITITSPAGASNSPYNIQSADGVYVTSAFQAIDTQYEVVRLDFGASKLIQDIQALTFYRVNSGLEFLVPGQFWVYGSNGGALTLLAYFTSPEGGTASTGVVGVNASFRYLHIYTASLAAPGNFDGFSQMDCLRVTGQP